MNSLALNVTKQSAQPPVIFIATSGVDKEVIEAHLSPVMEGLSRIDVKVHSAGSKDIDKALSQSHMLLLLEKNDELLKKAWEKGVVPVTHQFHQNIEDYNPTTEKGNSFVFRSVNQWEIFAAIVRAVETFKFPYDWKFIMRSCARSCCEEGACD